MCLEIHFNFLNFPSKILHRPSIDMRQFQKYRAIFRFVVQFVVNFMQFQAPFFKIFRYFMIRTNFVWKAYDEDALIFFSIY